MGLHQMHGQPIHAQLHQMIRFSHPPPVHAEHLPHAWQKSKYGTKVQFADGPSLAPILDATDTKRNQEIVSVLLYYARAVDSTLLAALGTIATQQAKSTHDTMEAITQLLNYCATHPDATIQYHASNMILWIHSNASYLTAPKGQLCTTGYHFLSTRPTMMPTVADPPPPDNGPIDVLCQIMHLVLASAAKAKLGTLFLSAKHACPLCIALQELGHDQPTTVIQTEIPLPPALPMTTSNKNDPNLSTCAFTGSVTRSIKASTIFLAAR